MAKLNLSSPWVIFYRKVNAMFEDDPDIKVVYDDTNDELKLKLYVNGSMKAKAIETLLPPEIKFGTVTLTILVISANLNKYSRSRKMAVGDAEFNDLDDIFRWAFTGNPNFEIAYSIEGIFDNPICYVIFAKKVVQFFTDDLGDANGVCSTLFQDIAKDIFVPMNGVYYCTSTDHNWETDERIVF